MADQRPADRMQLSQIAPTQYAAMSRLERSIELDAVVRELVKVRASQINGCAFCIDMHWKDARAASEHEERLYMLSAWREASLYSERERAALELCEAMTLIGDGHVPDQVWEQARSQFGEYELSQLVFAITAINAWNRLAISTRLQPGHYKPAEPQAA